MHAVSDGKQSYGRSVELTGTREELTTLVEQLDLGRKQLKEDKRLVQKEEGHEERGAARSSVMRQNERGCAVEIPTIHPLFLQLSE